MLHLQKAEKVKRRNVQKESLAALNLLNHAAKTSLKRLTCNCLLNDLVTSQYGRFFYVWEKDHRGDAKAQRHKILFKYGTTASLRLRG